MVISLDGNKVIIQEDDSELIEQNISQIVRPPETTELGDALKEMNRDDVSRDRLASIDFRTRIHPLELPPMIALDSLIGLKVVPVRCGVLNRVKMRKSVSLQGQGRKEFVEMVTGKRESDLSFQKKIGNFFTGGEK
jgi:hypothetical protein